MPMTGTPNTSFREGDLFYGLQEPRNEMLKQKAGHLFGARKKGALVNYYNVGDVAKGVDAADDNDSFVQFVTTGAALDKDAAAKHMSIVGQFDLTPKGFNSNWPLWKRKSKAGLYWATRVSGKHIHFVLRGLDIDTVVAKNFKSDSPQGPARKQVTNWRDKGTSITGAELRWLYRNRKDPRVHAAVQFWDDDGTGNFVPVEAPWVTNPAPWAAYKPTKEFTETPDKNWTLLEGQM